jgi:hypothetical protein
VADRVFGFACLDGGDVAAYLDLPGVAVATDADEPDQLHLRVRRLLPNADEWVFLDLGEGLYATDTTPRT